MRYKILMFLAVATFLSSWFITVGAVSVIKDNTTEISNSLKDIQTLSETISVIKSPDIKTPSWLQAQIDAEQAASRRSSYSGATYTYSVETRGVITASLSEFKSQANQTLNDSRGWARMGVNFQELASGGNFILVLSEAAWVPSFAPTVCSSVWSCQVGAYVIINQDRWLGASDAWNQAGGSLRDYRHMVINHETGHRLGHGHIYTCGAGGLAPVMMQQSINLNGCSFNPWPLDNELWRS